MMNVSINFGNSVWGWIISFHLNTVLPNKNKVRTSTPNYFQLFSECHTLPRCDSTVLTTD